MLIILWIIGTIFCLWLYHQIFDVVYFDLGNGLFREVLYSAVGGAIIAGLIMWIFSKIVAAVLFVLKIVLIVVAIFILIVVISQLYHWVKGLDPVKDAQKIKYVKIVTPICGAVIVAVCIVVGINLVQNNNKNKAAIEVVKNGHLGTYDNVSIEKLFEGTIGDDISWKVYKDNGNRCVEATISKSNNDVHIEFVCAPDTEDYDFILHNMKLDDDEYNDEYALSEQITDFYSKYLENNPDIELGRPLPSYDVILMGYAEGNSYKDDQTDGSSSIEPTVAPTETPMVEYTETPEEETTETPDMEEEEGTSENTGTQKIETEESTLVNEYFNVSASSTLEGYPVENVMDGDLSTAWVEDAQGVGVGECLYFEAKQNNIVVTSIEIANGYQKDKDTLLKNSQIKTVNLYTNEDISEYKFEKTTDIDNYKVIETIGTDPVQVLSLEILSAYKGKEYKDTCVSEVNIYGYVQDTE